MLDNTITLPVDEDNDGDTTDIVAVRIDEYPQRSVYKLPEHTLARKSTLGFYRTPVKPSGNDLGVAKSAIKITEDVEVLNKIGETVVKPAIGNADFSFPVGISAAAAMKIRQRLIAVIDHALAVRVTESLEI